MYGYKILVVIVVMNITREIAEACGTSLTHHKYSLLFLQSDDE
jgi:hypothetical protein